MGFGLNGGRMGGKTEKPDFAPTSPILPHVMHKSNAHCSSLIARTTHASSARINSNATSVHPAWLRTANMSSSTAPCSDPHAHATDTAASAAPRRKRKRRGARKRRKSTTSRRARKRKHKRDEQQRPPAVHRMRTRSQRVQQQQTTITVAQQPTAALTVDDSDSDSSSTGESDDNIPLRELFKRERQQHSINDKHCAAAQQR